MFLPLWACKKAKTSAAFLPTANSHWHHWREEARVPYPWTGGVWWQRGHSVYYPMTRTVVIAGADPKYRKRLWCHSRAGPGSAGVGISRDAPAGIVKLEPVGFCGNSVDQLTPIGAPDLFPCATEERESALARQPQPDSWEQQGRRTSIQGSAKGMVWPAAPVPQNQILTLLSICASSRRPIPSSIVEFGRHAGGSPRPADVSQSAKPLRT